MKKGILLALAIGITIAGLYLSRQIYQAESGQEVKLPPVLDSVVSKESTTPIPGQKNIPDVAVSEQDRKQLSTLNEILSSRNDNDMRLDTDLKVLSAGAKSLLRKRYQEIRPESRNDRGTIVFLLGRNITSEEDIGFMDQVLNELPCRSLANCREDIPPQTDDHGHGEMGLEVTLAYPQIYALKGLERVLDRGSNDLLYANAMDSLRRAKASSTPKIAEMARELEQKYLGARP